MRVASVPFPPLLRREARDCVFKDTSLPGTPPGVNGHYSDVEFGPQGARERMGETRPWRLRRRLALLLAIALHLVLASVVLFFPSRVRVAEAVDRLTSTLIWLPMLDQQRTRTASGQRDSIQRSRQGVHSSAPPPVEARRETESTEPSVTHDWTAAGERAAAAYGAAAGPIRQFRPLDWHKLPETTASGPLADRTGRVEIGPDGVQIVWVNPYCYTRVAAKVIRSGEDWDRSAYAPRMGFTRRFGSQGHQSGLEFVQRATPLVCVTSESGPAQGNLFAPPAHKEPDTPK